MSSIYLMHDVELYNSEALFEFKNLNLILQQKKVYVCCTFCNLIQAIVCILKNGLHVFFSSQFYGLYSKHCAAYSKQIYFQVTSTVKV